MRHSQSAEQNHELAETNDFAFHWFLYVMDADGSNQRRVSTTPVGMLFEWSPDGKKFLFQSSYEDLRKLYQLSAVEVDRHPAPQIVPHIEFPSPKRALRRAAVQVARLSCWRTFADE